MTERPTLPAPSQVHDLTAAEAVKLAATMKEETLTTTPQRALLVELVCGALRAEHGVRYRYAAKRPTDFYAGRRAGFVASTARTLAMFYGADYDASKHAVGDGVRKAGEGLALDDLIDTATAEAAARVILGAALLAE